AFPWTFTLTARISGRDFAGIPRTSSFSCFASSGQKLRHSGSMNVTITGRPRYAASVTGAPFWSTRLKPGARRVAAGQVTGGGCVPAVTAPDGFERCSDTISTPARTPATTTAPQSAQRRLRATGAGRSAEEGGADTARWFVPWDRLFRGVESEYRARGEAHAASSERPVARLARCARYAARLSGFGVVLR